MSASGQAKLNPIRLNNPVFLSAFFGLWILAVFLLPDGLQVLGDYFRFAFLGITGAIFANSTGAGGGVVFIPAFNQLGFSEAQAIATSFGIQCFGMTAGAFTWTHLYRHEKRDLHVWRSFPRIILVTALTSIAGIWLTYGMHLAAPASLHFSFSLFSVLLGVGILGTVWWIKPGRERSRLSWPDILALSFIGLIGGLITAWLSVGVGELLAIYLILRRFDVTMAVAAAVVVSAITVWAAIPQHAFIQPNLFWQVILFAGPGAVIGGIFAKTLVSYLSARKLKIFFACWLLILGGAGLPIF